MKETAPIDELLTVQELAQRLRVRPGWIYQRIHSNTLPVPYIKIGHFPRFPKNAVERFLREQLQVGQSA